MTEELISFETAKLAKEKGFTEIIFESDGKGTLTGIHKAPTQSLLQKWLREEHDIHFNIGTGFYPESKKRFYQLQIFINHWTSAGLHKTYEEALEEGLQEALKLIK